MSIKNTDFGLQVSIGTVGKALGAAIGFFGSVVLARTIGDTGYGAYYFLLSISMFIDNPITQWAVACRKRMTEASFPTDRAAGGIFIGAVVGSILILLTTIIYNQVFGEIRGTDVRLLAVLFTGVVFFTGTKQILAGTSKFGLNSWVEIAREVARIGLQIALVFVIADVAGMVWGITIASLLIVPIVVKITGISPSLPTRADLKHIFKFAKVSIPNGFVSSALSQVDIIILGTLASAAFVGNYRIAMNLLFPGSFIVATLAPGIMSKVSNIDSQDEDPSKVVTNSLSFASILAIPIGVGGIVIGDLVAVTVYSSEFSRAGIFIGWLGIYYIFQTQMRILTSTLSGLDRPDLVLKVNGIGFFLNAILGVGLYYLIGPVGVVYATVVGIFVRYLLGAIWVRDQIQIKLLPRPIYHQLFSALFMGSVLYVIRTQLSLSSWIWVIGSVGLGGIIYFLVLTAISQELRETAKAITKDAIATISLIQ